MIDIIKDLNELYNTFGFEAQCEKLNEECDEYCNAWFEENWHWCNEEIADVFIVSAQLVLNNPEIYNIVLQKIERTKQRIKDGYYENRTGN